MATPSMGTVDSHSEIARRTSDGLMRQYNGIKNLQIDANAVRKPDYFVYVFTVAPRAFEVRQPNALPFVRIPACEQGEKVKYVCKFPNVVNQIREDPNTQGKAEITGLYGEGVAMSLCNPGNPTLNQDQEFSPGDPYQAENLTKWGVFWSLNEVPTEKEIEWATAKLHKTLRALIQEADNLAQMGPEGRKQILESTHYVAAKYFGYEGVWNTVVQIPVECPNCGSRMKKGAAYHRTEDGIICVIDWKRTVSAGVKSKSDVPDELVWWEKPKRGRPPQAESEAT